MSLDSPFASCTSDTSVIEVHICLLFVQGDKQID